MNNMPLRIMTRDFQMLDEVDLYSSLQITRSWHGIGQVELVINRYLKGADKLNRGCIVFPHAHLDKGYIIRYKQIQLDENGKATENWVIKAPSLKSLIGQCLAYPQEYEGDAETVIHQLVMDNVVDPTDSKRKISDIVLADNLNRGKHIKLSTNYENLAEVIEQISLQSGLGWNIVIDRENKRFILGMMEGYDLTDSQSNLPPAKFSTEFGSLESMSYMESDLDYKNVAIVIGPDKPGQEDVPDEEKEKYMVVVGDAEGHERFEMLVNASVDTEIEVDENAREPRPEEDIIADMITVGENELAENTQEIYVEGQALTKSRLTYQKDYDLGDMVTLQNKDWGITMDARITEVKEIYEPGNIKIDLTFDNSFPTLIDKIKREIKRN